jgi:tRNA A-37 threonylcarbamoyl transferase component Bud32
MVNKASAKTAVVKYESPTALTSRRVAVVATALLIVLFPLPLLYPMFVPVIHGLPEAVLLMLSIGAFVFFLIAFNAYRINRNTRLVLTDTGIVLPGKGGELSKDMIPWSKVEQIEVTTPGGDKMGSIIFSLKGWSPIILQLSSLAHEDLDKLVSACELWANATAKDESFKRLVERVTLKRRDSDDSSFTALWMEEAQRRLSTTPFSPLDPGAELQSGRLKVVQPLTAGGWSAIYLCQWQERTSAILKEAVVPPSAKEELKAKAYQHFEREAVLLAGLEHPQIAKVMDYFIENGRQYMVLQRISGANLRSYIRDRGAVSERQAVKWARELLNIVSYLHGQDPPIIHRDLTPENLVLDMRGSLVLIDFGSANEFVGTVTGTLVGKPSYISPEQFSGHAKPQSDLYSLGAVLSFILTGKDPEPLTVANPREQNQAVSEQLNLLVQEMTQLDAKKRIKSVDDASKRLDEIAGSLEEAQDSNQRIELT